LSTAEKVQVSDTRMMIRITTADQQKKLEEENSGEVL